MMIDLLDFQIANFARCVEIAVDMYAIDFDDKPFQYAVTSKPRKNAFLSQRKYLDFPTTSGFSKDQIPNVYSFYLLEVGDRVTSYTRTVPHILKALATAGGLFGSLRLLTFYINMVFFSPIESINFYEAYTRMTDQEDQYTYQFGDYWRIQFARLRLCSSDLHTNIGKAKGRIADLLSVQSQFFEKQEKQVIPIQTTSVTDQQIVGADSEEPQVAIDYDTSNIVIKEADRFDHKVHPGDGISIKDEQNRIKANIATSRRQKAAEKLRNI